MTIEITRELLERHLRATKATEEYKARLARRMDGGEPAWVVANSWNAQTVFRLGLCAAVEQAESMAQAHIGAKVGRELARLEGYLLRAAGFDTPEKLAAWEAAK